jgi:hypothetical protein
MIREINPNKSFPEPAPAAGKVLSKPPSTQEAKPAASLPAAPPRSISAQAAASGLPSDKLSAAIVSFARFFSLPLKPQTLAAIRRQAFSPAVKQPEVMRTPSQTTQSDPAKFTAAEKSSALEAAKGREALSLAAAAAESKGVELQPKGLEMYAQAVDPQRQRDSGGQNHSKRDRKQNEQEEKVPHKTAPITAESLKQTALEYTEKNQLLDILNRLPCKNGQRWIVLPFDFCEDGFEFNASMRVLLDNEKVSNRAVCMALDILIINDKKEHDEQGGENNRFERRGLFVLESANDKPLRLSVYFWPELTQKRHKLFGRELSQLLEIPLERVYIKNKVESFPYEAGRKEPLTAVDEEY